MATLTLYRTRCGRWPAGPPTTELAEVLPAAKSCESCLRIVARAGDTEGGTQVTWIRRRPDLSWHALIPNYTDADPSLLPAGVPRVPPGPDDIALGVRFGELTAVAGPARQPGETDDDIRAKAGLT